MSLLLLLLALMQSAGSNHPTAPKPSSLIDILGMKDLIQKVEVGLEKLGKSWEKSIEQGADRMVDRATTEAKQIVQPYEIGAGVAGGLLIAALVVSGIALGVAWAALRSVKKLILLRSHFDGKAY